MALINRFPTFSHDIESPHYWDPCFHEDPWWEDLSIYINNKVLRAHPDIGLAEVETVMRASLSKLKYYEIEVSSQAVPPMWDFLTAPTSNYVDNCHHVYHINVPEDLPYLYAFCLRINIYTRGNIMYHDDCRDLEVFLEERFQKRHHWANTIGSLAKDYSEYEIKYVPILTGAIDERAGPIVRRRTYC